jgi:hypothetical protein
VQRRASLLAYRRTGDVQSLQRLSLSSVCFRSVPGKRHCASHRRIRVFMTRAPLEPPAYTYSIRLKYGVQCIQHSPPYSPYTAANMAPSISLFSSRFLVSLNLRKSSRKQCAQSSLRISNPYSLNPLDLLKYVSLRAVLNLLHLNNRGFSCPLRVSDG